VRPIVLVEDVEVGRILVADDDETFLQSTAELLQQEGYQCDCAQNPAVAAQRIGENEYDLLIADTGMPGNSDLELIRDVANAKGVRVILVTGYPSVDLAILSIGLRVQAFLLKPFDFQELLGHVHVAVRNHRLDRSVHHMRQRLQYWDEEAGVIEESQKHGSEHQLSVSLDSFLQLTYHNVVGTVSDLKNLTRALAERCVEEEPCHLFSCPRLKALTDALTETVATLEKTKKAFKSKDLAAARMKLEGLVI